MVIDAHNKLGVIAAITALLVQVVSLANNFAVTYLTKTKATGGTQIIKKRVPSLTNIQLNY